MARIRPIAANGSVNDGSGNVPLIGHCESNLIHRLSSLSVRQSPTTVQWLSYPRVWLLVITDQRHFRPLTSHHSPANALGGLD